MRGSLLIVLLLGALLVAPESRAERRLPEYRYFRALSIDLAGRPPTRAELAAFEQPGFDLDAWIATHLGGAGYAERVRRIYMDVLRLEVGPSFAFVPNSLELRRHEVLGPAGPENVYFRRGQRRVDPATDGDFCLTADETGQQFPANAAPIGGARPVTQAVLDARTVVVKPWWLYADYRAAVASDRVAPDWAKRFPGFAPVPGLLVEPDGKTPTTQVRVCREEAQTTETGAVYASGRAGVKKGEPPPAGRLTQPPGDAGFARSNKGRAVSCLSGTGFQSSVECGCGIGLERCVPGAGFVNEPPAFVLPTHTPLGGDAPFESTPQPAAAWERLWWSEEAKHFLDKILLDDRDFRELLTSRATVVNGPLAQFYRFFAGATCCGASADLGYGDPTPLVEPAAIPEALVPEDTATWLAVADRGPYAAGILTMPIFLTKYGSRRARAHVVYSAFLCRDFVAEAVRLVPSSEPDLTRRPGCATCHQTLEPMAAYFTRVMESDWTYLPADKLPMAHPACTKAKGQPGACKTIYDPAFPTTLRGAYASQGNAEAGPAGLAAAIAGSPELAPCVAETVAGSLLGRPLAPEDAAWKAELAKTFVAGGYRMRALVKAIVTSPRYRDANDLRRQ
ncbi:MAG: DUF1585 domain-containing protein [Kofleriaceae bacterium]